MHPLAFQRMWKLSSGRLPHLDRSTYDSLIEMAGELHEPQDAVCYWGIVGQQVQYRGHQLLHCYNFGNADIQYPWTAQLLNFGRSVPARITRGGTVKSRQSGHTLLDRIMAPYLVFGFEADAAMCEHLQPGMLVAAGQSRQCREFDMALPEGQDAPSSSGILYYYLMKRMPFLVEPADRWVPPGAIAARQCFRVKLQQPVVMEPGWPVLMLEKDRWFWGVVRQ